MSDEKLKASTVQTMRPRLFVENVGQYDSRIRFAAIGGGTNLRLTDDTLWLTVVPAERTGVRQRLGVSRPGTAAKLTPAWVVNLRLTFVGSNTKTPLKSFAPLSSVVSYLRGNDPASWRAKLSGWGGVTYSQLYPGVDLDVQSDKTGRLELRLRAAPAPKVKEVRLRIEGAEFVATNISQPGEKEVSSFDGLHILTVLGRVFVSLISFDPAFSRKLSVEQVGLQTFDVICPFK